MSIPIFQQDGFRIGIGDSNNDGRLDFDFGLRSETWGNSPWGSGHNGFEIGLNTDRGVYAGGDYSRHNGWGSHGGGGRVFADGGYETNSWSGDVFGNHHQSYESAGPWHYRSQSHGGNVYSGNYGGHDVSSNWFGTSSHNYAGNSWTGAQVGNYSNSNVFGGHQYGSYATPPFVPPHGGGHYGRCGCNSVSAFMFG